MGKKSVIYTSGLSAGETDIIVIFYILQINMTVRYVVAIYISYLPYLKVGFRSLSSVKIKYDTRHLGAEDE